MKIYISNDIKRTLKKNYPDIFDKQLAIIDVPMIANFIKYEEYHKDVCVDYVLTQEIEKRLHNVYESKRFYKLLYLLNNPITLGFVSNFRRYVEDHGIYFVEYILIDYSQQIDPKIYKHFDNVI